MSIQTTWREPLTGPNSIPQANQLLASLPEDDRLRLSPYLRHIPLRCKQVVLRQGQPVEEVIFPIRGVCALVKTTEDGHTIEIIGIGSEGAVGAGVVLGQWESAADVVVQVSDEALSLPLDVFKRELQRRGALSTVMVSYCHAFTTQLMQAGACNALHSAEQRCSRWLLTMQDRIQADGFPITQEMLAMALGVRRPTVTLIMAGLHRAGLVQYFRGAVKVLDRTALVARACECYPTLSPISAGA